MNIKEKKRLIHKFFDRQPWCESVNISKSGSITVRWSGVRASDRRITYEGHVSDFTNGNVKTNNPKWVKFYKASQAGKKAGKGTKVK